MYVHYFLGCFFLCNPVNLERLTRSLWIVDSVISMVFRCGMEKYSSSLLKCFLSALYVRKFSFSWTQAERRHPDVKILAAHSENKTLLIFHMIAQSLKSLISCSAPTGLLWKLKAFFFYKASEKEAGDEKFTIWEPATNICFLLEFSWPDECMVLVLSTPTALCKLHWLAHRGIELH